MPNFTAGTSFTDGVTNDVTAAKLNALVADAVPTSSLSLNSTTGTISLFSSGTGTAATPAIQPAGDANTGIFFPAADTIAFSEGGAESMRIDSSGQVGVGVTPSAWGTGEYKAIQVGIGGSISGRVSSGDQDKVNVAANVYNDGTVFKYIASDDATIYQQTGGIHVFSNAPSGTAGNTATFTERLRIDSSGNVGIGTASPVSVLDMSKASDTSERAIRVQNSSSDLYVGTEGTSGNRFSGSSVNNVFFGTTGASGIELATNNNVRMTINSSGNVGIGGTPSTLLHIQSTSPSLRIQAASGNSGALDFYRTASVNSGQIASESTNALVFSTNGVGNSGLAERLRIDSSGNLLVGTTDSALTTGVGLKLLASATEPLMGYVINTANGASSNYHIYNINATNNGYRFYVTANGGISNFSANNVNLSDERLKTNINPSGNYLDKICSIPVKTFNYKDQGEDTEKTIGVLAQEVEAHIPELINNDGFGETPADGIPLKTIYQTDLQYVLMRCIQELSAKVTALEAA